MKKNLGILFLIVLLMSCDNSKERGSSEHSLASSLAIAMSAPAESEDSTDRTDRTSATQSATTSPEISHEEKSPQELGDTMISVVGKRSLEDINREVLEQLISVNYWYAIQFPTAVSKKRITVTFTVDGQGIPHNVALLSTDVQNTEFVKKVLDDVAKWRFAWYPHGSDTTTVIYPITLRPAPKL